jgi:hypothetical protein
MGAVAVGARSDSLTYPTTRLELESYSEGTVLLSTERGYEEVHSLHKDAKKEEVKVVVWII